MLHRLAAKCFKNNNRNYLIYTIVQKKEKIYLNDGFRTIKTDQIIC